MGFPFFVPAFIPGNRIRLYSCHPKLEQAIRAQNHEPSFPVEFESLAANIEFIHLTAGESYEICGANVVGMRQLHSNESFGYRIEKNGKSVIYSTDSEHKPENAEAMNETAAFFRNADLVIFDAMYSLADAVSMKEDWGHSSNILGVELSQASGAKALCLFHHEPVNSDEDIERIFTETIRFEEITRSGAPLKIHVAYDGLVLDV
jgi:ribonuclease BN (tRNA processing enzyme)